VAKFVIDTLTDGTEHYEQFVELDGREYLFRFDWNIRDESWYFGIYLPDETPLATSRRMAVGRPLLLGEIDDRLPPGLLMAIDTSGKEEDADLDELGARVIFAYFDAAEFGK